LGLGVLSVAPSSATVGGLTLSVTNGTALAADGAMGETSTAALVQTSAILPDANDSYTVNIVQKSYPTGGSAVKVRFGFFETNTGVNTKVLNNATTGTSLTTHAAGAYGISTGGVALYDSVTAVTSAASEFYAVSVSSAGYAGAKFGITIETSTARAAGAYVYTVMVRQYDNGAYKSTITSDVTLTVATAANLSTTVAPASSVAYLNAGTGTSATADAVVTSVATASDATVATIPVRTYNAAGGAAPESVTATITGAGILCYSTTCGNSLTLNADGTYNLIVKANGTAGVATINVSTPTVTFAPKTVTFYAKAAKTLTAAVYNPVLKVGSNATAVAVTAADANGVNWAGQAYIVASAAADALVGGSATTPVACAYDSTYKTHFCPVTTIATGTAKFKVIDASTVALATATSNEVTVTVSNAAPTSVKLAFDKATYAPFEKALITVTVLGSDGKTLQGQAYTNLLATGGISSTYAFGAASDTLTAVSFSTAEATSAGSTTAGAKTYVVYMPAAGDVKITATGGTALAAAGQVEVSATASVVNSSVDAATDAANEATDAANAATDAALAAADAADAATAAAQDASDAVAALSATVAKLVASLKAQITSLTNLVIKIQKKVKA
jgi:hypothetical protein